VERNCVDEIEYTVVERRQERKGPTNAEIIWHFFANLRDLAPLCKVPFNYLYDPALKQFSFYTNDSILLVLNKDAVSSRERSLASTSNTCVVIMSSSTPVLSVNSDNFFFRVSVLPTKE
jgi:hypothetical protein